MGIISFLTQGWVIGSALAVVALLVVSKIRYSKKRLEHDWMGSEYTKNLYVTIAKRPILLLNNNKPLKVTNYKEIIAKKIRKNLIKKINTNIYKGMLIDNEQYVIVSLSMVEESMLPYEYQDSFNSIFKESYVKLVKEYESAGYDIETDFSGQRLSMKIWGKSK